METNYREMEFRPYDPANNDCFCSDGELEGWGGCAAPGIDVEFTLDAGRLVAVHQGRAVVYLDGWLMWAVPVEGKVGEGDLERICDMHRPVSVAMLGDTLVTTGEDGLLYHRWTGGGYVSLPQLPQLPQIEFGLLKEGEMAAACTITVPAAMMPVAGGSGMSGTHPSANASGSGVSTDVIDRIVSTFVDRAHDDKRSRGYFTAPFFVRYAVRDRGGNCLCVSPPVLMAAGVLPPCMAVAYTSKTDKEAVMHARLDGSAYFSLMARACSLPDGWTDIVGSIDVYVSPQIPAYDSGAGYMCSYATVLRQVNSGRGRGSRGDSDGSVFAGHYSDDGVSYTDHYTAPELGDTDVWYVAPNVAMTSELAGEHRFYRIASIDAACLDGMSVFTKVTAESTSASQLEMCRRLDDEPQSAVIFPETLATLNGRIVAAGGSRGAVMPASLAVSAAFAGNTAAQATTPAVVSVYTRDGGGLRRLSVTCAMASDAAGCFPRFIYHPDGDAVMMTIECGGRRYRLPLARHPSMPGVYWFGGLGRDYVPDVDTGPLPEAVDGARIDCGGSLWLSTPLSPRHFSQSQSIIASNGRIRAVCGSVVTPDISSVGRYPVYVFADDGVWLVEYDSDRLRLGGSHRISGEVCALGASVAVTDDGVVFATAHSLMKASGAKVRRLMALSSLSVPSLPSLPGLVPAAAVPEGIKVSPPMLAYDGAVPSLVIADSVSGVTYVCDMATLAVARWCRRVVSMPLVCGRALVQTDLNEAAHISPQAMAADAGMLVTRPIKLTKSFTPKRIRSVTVWHGGAPADIGLKVYGANSLGSWHLIASSPCHRAEIVSRSPWRFLRIAVIPAPDIPRPAVYGAQVEWTDI